MNDETKLAAVLNILGRLKETGGETFRDGFISARAAIELEDVGLVNLEMWDDLEVIRLTEKGEKWLQGK